YNSQIERFNKFLPLMFPEKWRIQNPDYVEKLPMTKERISDTSISRQTDAIINWQGTCGELDEISHETLIIVGADDILIVPANSKLISDKIHNATLVQIPEAGHAAMMQYPQKFSDFVLTFLKS
ncbi:MAG: alpha/beta fold hydrolase, partial [Nitrososphaeraceae archaeon]